MFLKCVEDVQEGPSTPEEVRKSLVAISSCMRDIKKRTSTTDAMFEPLQEMVSPV